MTPFAAESIQHWAWLLQVVGLGLNLIGALAISRNLFKLVPLTELHVLISSALIRGDMARGVAAAGHGVTSNLKLLQALAFLVLGMLFQLVGMILEAF